ncbi:hypothetical protein DENSPDRAFT_885832 [Dentipellis sp. KUC8613]|nr:hypothetical protein DENSPDRAFT_885832 [Dentipellis sp. KUC8613]
MLPHPTPVARRPRSSCCRPARAVTTSRALATALDARSAPSHCPVHRRVTLHPHAPPCTPSWRLRHLCAAPYPPHAPPPRPACLSNGARRAPHALSARETASRRLATAPCAASLSLSLPRSRSRRPVRVLMASHAPCAVARMPLRRCLALHALATGIGRAPYAISLPRVPSCRTAYPRPAMHALLGASDIFAQPCYSPVKPLPRPTRPSNGARRALHARAQPFRPRTRRFLPPRLGCLLPHLHLPLGTSATLSRPRNRPPRCRCALCTLATAQDARCMPPAAVLPPPPPSGCPPPPSHAPCRRCTASAAVSRLPPPPAPLTVPSRRPPPPSGPPLPPFHAPPPPSHAPCHRLTPRALASRPPPRAPRAPSRPHHAITPISPPRHALLAPPLPLCAPLTPCLCRRCTFVALPSRPCLAPSPHRRARRAVVPLMPCSRHRCAAVAPSSRPRAVSPVAPSRPTRRLAPCAIVPLMPCSRRCCAFVAPARLRRALASRPRTVIVPLAPSRPFVVPVSLPLSRTSRPVHAAVAAVVPPSSHRCAPCALVVHVLYLHAYMRGHQVKTQKGKPKNWGPKPPSNVPDDWSGSDIPNNVNDWTAIIDKRKEARKEARKAWAEKHLKELEKMETDLDKMKKQWQEGDVQD